MILAEEPGARGRIAELNEVGQFEAGVAKLLADHGSPERWGVADTNPLSRALSSNRTAAGRTPFAESAPSRPMRFAPFQGRRYHPLVDKHEKLLLRILRGNSDANIRFAELTSLLRSLGFTERVRGSHHVSANRVSRRS